MAEDLEERQIITGTEIENDEYGNLVFLPSSGSSLEKQFIERPSSAIREIHWSTKIHLWRKNISDKIKRGT